MSSDRQHVEECTKSWTKFPNCILDNLDKFTPTEFLVLAFMVRKNIGYDDPNQMFSVEYISKKLGLDRKTVIKVITALLNKESIRVTKIGTRGIRYFDINWTEPKPEKTEQPEVTLDSEKKYCGKNSISVREKFFTDYKTDNNKKNDCNKADLPQPLLLSPDSIKKSPESQDYNSQKRRETTPNGIGKMSDRSDPKIAKAIPETTPKNTATATAAIGKEVQPLPLSPEDLKAEHDTLVSLIPEPMRQPVIINLVDKYHQSHGFQHVADCIVYTNLRPQREGNGTLQAYRGYLSKGLAGQYNGINGLYESFFNKKEEKIDEKDRLIISLQRDEKKRFILKDGRVYQIRMEGHVFDFEYINKNTGKLCKGTLTPEQIANTVVAGKATLE